MSGHRVVICQGILLSSVIVQSCHMSGCMVSYLLLLYKFGCHLSEYRLDCHLLQSCQLSWHRVGFHLSGYRFVICQSIGLSSVRGQDFPLSGYNVGWLSSFTLQVGHLPEYICQSLVLVVISQDIVFSSVRVQCWHMPLYRVVICQGIWLFITYDCIMLVIICQGIGFSPFMTSHCHFSG